MTPDRSELCFDWSGTGFSFRFRGSLLAAHFLAVYGEEPSGRFGQGPVKWKIWPRIAVFLDGEKTAYRVFTVDAERKTEILFCSEKTEEHVIHVLKLTESIKSGLSVVSFFADGRFLPYAPERRPVIEFIGDSITCGYGNTAAPFTQNFYTEDEDITKTYAALTADALGMEPRYLCISGGCVRNTEWNGRPYSLSEVYPYTDLWRSDLLGEVPERWDFRNGPADVVVINLGSNDIGSVVMAEDPAGAEEQFVRDYHDLVADIRRRNGAKTLIICTLGDLRYYLYDRITEAAARFAEESGDANIFCTKLRTYGITDVRGADGHPGLDAHRRMAEELTAFIRKHLPSVL